MPPNDNLEGSGSWRQLGLCGYAVRVFGVDLGLVAVRTHILDELRCFIVVVHPSTAPFAIGHYILTSNAAITKRLWYDLGFSATFKLKYLRL